MIPGELHHAIHTPALRHPSRQERAPQNVPLLAAVGLAAALTLTATACDSGSDTASGEPTASASQGGDGKIQIPDDIKDKLKEHGIDVDKWKDGAWKNWDKDEWLRQADDFINPIIKDLWDPARMRGADDPDKNKGVDDADLTGDQGVTDPEPAPVTAQAVKASYHAGVPEAGKVFFDAPEGTMVCSATVVEDPAHPGKSNLVWTAGHCVHMRQEGRLVPQHRLRALVQRQPAGRRRSWRAPRARRSLRTVCGGATGRRPRTSGSSRAVPRAAREPRTTTRCCM